MLGRHLRPPGLLPVVSIYMTWRVVVPVAIKPLPSVSCIQCSLLSPTPYMCFGGSLCILFSLDFRNVLCCRGLHNGYSTPMLRIWIGCVPIVYSGNIGLGVVYSYKALYCI